MISMEWSAVFEKDGEIIQEDSGTMSGSEVDQLTQACLATSPNALARVACTVSKSLAYGEVKCSFTVSLSVPQSKAWMERASKTAFAAALQYTNDGFSWLAPGAPRTEGPPDGY